MKVVFILAYKLLHIQYHFQISALYFLIPIFVLYCYMKKVNCFAGTVYFFVALFTVIAPLHAQVVINSSQWINELNLTGSLPDKLLSTRSVVFYQFGLTEHELNKVQEYFKRTGVDAVVYMELDMLLANVDAVRAHADYLNKREVANLIFLDKVETQYRIVVTTFSGKETVLEKGQNAWQATNTNLEEAVKTLYRTAANSLKKQNMLINDFPEMEYSINFILGKRNDFFAMDLKVDMLAVPKTGDDMIDQQLAAYFQQNYPLKHKLTEPGLSDKELRKQGYLYVVRLVCARGVTVKKLLGYDLTKAESAYTSVTYPEGAAVLKSIPASQKIFKAYFKHIDSGNVFLGTKWDADLTWQEALRNQINGLKLEFKLP